MSEFSSVFRKTFSCISSNISQLIFLLIPLLTFALSGYFIEGMNIYKLRLSLIELAISSMIIFLIIILIKKKSLKKIFFYTFYLILAVNVFFQLSYYQLYSERISASTIFILMESNADEITEYLLSYFSKFHFFIALTLLFPLAFCRWVFKSSKSVNHSWRSRIVLLIIIGGLAMVYSVKSLGNFNLYMITLKSYKEYIKKGSLYDEFGIDKKIGNFENISGVKTSERKVYVLVLGESTTKRHMSIYDYPRVTNPRLETIKDNLLVFKDVISPHAHTIPSVMKMFSLNHYENESRLQKGSLIQLMNQAGFRTYWISNQKPIGWNENFITKIARASNKLNFLNVRNYNVQGQYDEIVLKPLEEALNEKGDLFIVIHLLGTHARYSYRYPLSFDRFKTDPPFLNMPAGKNTVNEYDNAVLYNDYILFEIIKRVRSQNDFSYVLYTSDHGEDVYRVSKGAFHAEKNGTYPMYEVPFILWRSEKFKTGRKLTYDTDRKYMLDDLIFSLADLSGIGFGEFDSKRSIFNKNFEPRKRIIYNNKNYDSIFHHEN